ncbi:MAG: hypothetical protein FJ295_21355 [Planctomycetes bacterium]|nr:hypothetical protein [Planctomycetota bacterium]
MPLTVAEKEHWKNQISKRIDKKIEKLTASDANFFDRIKRDAHDRAVASLGLAELDAEGEAVERQRAELSEREQRVNRQKLARVRGVPAESLDTYAVIRGETEIQNAIMRRQTVHEDELLRESDLGRQVIALRAEKESLLDSIWLAASSAEIKVFWSKVTDLLGDEQTALQRDALAIPPVKE